MNLNRQRIATTVAGVGLLASLFFAGAATAAPGGPGPGGGHHIEKRVEKMQAELGLTPDQVSRIKAIVDSNKAEMKTLHEQMRATFTPEQQAQMKAWKEQRKEAKERPSRESMKERWEQLGLSEGQRQQLQGYREQIKNKRQSTQAQVQAVLTAEQQAKWEAKKAEFREKHRDGKGRRGAKPQ